LKFAKKAISDVLDAIKTGDFETAENSLVPVKFHALVTESKSVLTVTDPEGRSCTVAGPGAEQARTVELTPEALAERLSRTGGTPFRCGEVSSEIGRGLTLSAAVINGLRRDALNQLAAVRARREKPNLGKAQKLRPVDGFKELPGLAVQVTSREQITEKLLKMKPVVLYVPLHILALDPVYCHELNRRVPVAAVLPRIVHDTEIDRLREDLRLVRKMGVKEALVGNLGLLLVAREAGFQIRGDYGLNVYNSGSVDMMRQLELRSATLSFEMTLPQIRDVSKAVPCEIFAYGRLPLMVTENCLIRGRTGSCSCNLGVTKLVDKTGAEFPIIKDGDKCRSILLNGKKLSWLDRQNDLNKLGLWAIRLYFTTENTREVDRVLNDYLDPKPFDPGACTRGLYLRGVE
jgi:putative protease